MMLFLKICWYGTPIVISVKLIGEERKATVSHAEDSPVGGGYRPRHGHAGCLSYDLLTGTKPGFKIKGAKFLYSRILESWNITTRS